MTKGRRLALFWSFSVQTSTEADMFRVFFFSLTIHSRHIAASYVMAASFHFLCSSLFANNLIAKRSNIIVTDTNALCGQNVRFLKC
jgi:hypothetical protein